MKKMTILFTLLLCVTALFSQQKNDERKQFLMAPSSTFSDGLLGYVNPANNMFYKSLETRFAWSTDGSEMGSFDDWGLFFAAKGLGFGMVRQNLADASVTDYRISNSMGNKMVSFGVGYEWSSGDTKAFNRTRLINTGLVYRPNRFVSLGVIGNFSLKKQWQEGVAELGVRPLGSPLLTVFGDMSLETDQDVNDALWGVGAAIQPVKGVHIVGRYFSNEAFTAGLSFNFGLGGVASQAVYDADQNHASNTYMVRSGGLTPSFINSMVGKKTSFIPVNLKGRVDHLNYQLFDDHVHRLYDLASDIRKAAADPTICALVFNLTGMAVRSEHAWEIRQEMLNAQKNGIKIIIFVENVGMTNYHLASVADYLVMDPYGMMMLPGYSMNSTYYKGTLDKLGLGYDEWRFFKYKSAAERLSRTTMSAADREQRQALLDDIYETLRADVCESRGFTNDEFDAFVDSTVAFMADDALEAGLVDTLARWTSMDEIVKNVMKKKMFKKNRGQIFANAIQSDEWGEQPKLAIIYGLGECAMDTGIRGRWLERVFLKISKMKNIKAVVFRVDSPGGDPMASDVVAEALKKCAKEKPVIISQGAVAASGGYWISMYGDEIVAAPTTITGSIGVIGGWLYDKGLSGKIGATNDMVKRGAHADVYRGIALPLLGEIPARNLTEFEKKIVEQKIQSMYTSFVKSVANGRGLSEDSVRVIAEGHVYSGLDGKEIGLVDEIGGLLTAVAIAEEKAGFDIDELDIIEVPKYKGLIDLAPALSPIHAKIKNDPIYHYFEMFQENPGMPMPVVTPEYVDFSERTEN